LGGGGSVGKGFTVLHVWGGKKSQNATKSKKSLEEQQQRKG